MGFSFQLFSRRYFGEENVHREPGFLGGTSKINGLRKLILMHMAVSCNLVQVIG